MGFWSSVMSAAQSVGFMRPNRRFYGLPQAMGDMSPGVLNDAIQSQILGMNIRTLWRTQPNLRTVVSFRASNLAQLGLQSFTRGPEDSRIRDRDGVIPQLLDYVDGVHTQYDLLYGLSSDLDLYDRGYVICAADGDSPLGWSLRRIPPMWVSEVQSNPFGVDFFLVSGSSGSPVQVPADSMIYFGGYDPDDPVGYSSAVESLRETLNEQIQASIYRRQIWERGGRVSSVIKRPAGAPDWSDAARERFQRDWKSKYTGDGGDAGGTPMLEDGMDIARVDFNAKEQQFVDVARLSLQTVASAFHVDPTMIGASDSATYSNVKAFRQMLYNESLGPTLTRIEQRFNRDLTRILGVDGEFVEFNIKEKLSGDFADEAAIISTSTGGPWMTRNEARARQNLPPIQGADELIVPLNVVEGGQASPQDSGSQNTSPDAADRAENSRVILSKAWRVKAPDGDADTSNVSDVLTSFFDRQGRSVLSRIGAGSKDWWDSDRWNGELADDIVQQMQNLSVDSAKQMLKDHGIDPSTYDVDRTVKFLQKCAADRAADINDATEQAVQDAIDDPDSDPADVYTDDANDARGSKIATSVVAFASSFGAVEAGRQQGGNVTKTWVTGDNPRPEHAAMDGETVPIDGQFSNGLDWPGSFGDPDEVAGCNCSIDLNFPD